MKFWLPLELDPATRRTPVAQRIRVVQALELVRQLPLTLGGNLSLSALTALTLWSTAPSAYLLFWVSLFWITAFPGVRQWRRFRGAPEPESVSVRLIWRASLFSLLVAVPWAIGNWFLFNPAHFEHELFLVFVTGGITAGVVSMLATIPAVSLVFVMATVTPLIARLLLAGGSMHVVMAIMLIIYVGVLAIFVRNSHKSLIAGVELEIDKQKVIKKT